MPEALKILFAEDFDPDHELTLRELNTARIHFTGFRVWKEDDFRKALHDFQPHIVVSDYNMPAFTGMQALRIAHEFDPYLPFIILTGSVNEETAVECLKAGASDYVLKERIKRLPFAVSDALLKRKTLIEKQEALQRLQESAEQLRQAQKIASIGSWEFDLNTGMVAASDEARRIYGIGNGKRNIEAIQSQVLQEYRTMLNIAMKEHMETGKPYDVEFQIVRESDREIRHIQSMAVFNKSTNKITGIIRDITDFKINEQLRQEIHIARESARFKQSFIANISHEIRTPLTSIGGIVELMSDTSLDETQQEFLGILRFSVENLRTIINEVLDFSSIEAGIVKLQLTGFAVAEVFDNAEKLFSSICRKPLAFQMRGIEALPAFIYADRQKILQVLINFISNAVKYTNQGVITLEGRCENSAEGKPILKFLLHDQGKGIRPELKEKLFLPFSQIHDNKELQIEGTGLGLSISKEIVGLMGGEIGVESEPGHGSTFWFTVPFAPGKLPESILKEPSSGFSLNKGNALDILLAEDKQVNQKVISMILTNMGHKVTLAANGMDAYELCMKHTFDLVLMDVQMPVLDGVEATRKLRKECPGPLVIVGLSANAMEGDREKYIQLGMDDYLTKPVKGADFLALITRLFTGKTS